MDGSLKVLGNREQLHISRWCLRTVSLCLVPPKYSGSLYSVNQNLGMVPPGKDVPREELEGRKCNADKRTWIEVKGIHF